MNQPVTQDIPLANFGGASTATHEYSTQISESALLSKGGIGVAR